mmetsp:Transcript_9172/g.38850  ORF Transcript_9172/g.38850 Transcript_9172/m.38850 type:complete len:308 (-) Transcript_9172:847-1770(-)
MVVNGYAATLAAFASESANAAAELKKSGLARARLAHQPDHVLPTPAFVLVHDAGSRRRRNGSGVGESSAPLLGVSQSGARRLRGRIRDRRAHRRVVALVLFALPPPVGLTGVRVVVGGIVPVSGDARSVDARGGNIAARRLGRFFLRFSLRPFRLTIHRVLRRVRAHGLLQPLARLAHGAERGRRPDQIARRVGDGDVQAVAERRREKRRDADQAPFRAHSGRLRLRVPPRELEHERRVRSQLVAENLRRAGQRKRKREGSVVSVLPGARPSRPFRRRVPHLPVENRTQRLDLFAHLFRVVSRLKAV